MQTKNGKEGRLSARQQQVLVGFSTGESSKETAARLKISVRTVEVHKARIMKALRVHSSLLAFIKATESGMLVIQSKARGSEIVIRLRKKARRNGK